MSSALSFFFFNDTATTEIYTLSLHDALPISSTSTFGRMMALVGDGERIVASFEEVGIRLSSDSGRTWREPDRKSTRLNSSHANISYAVFCLKKKKKK